jgi:transposase
MEDIKIKGSRRAYSDEYKERALELAARNGVAQTARDLGISESMLYNWRAKQERGNGSIAKASADAAELARLRREVKRLGQENAFLKKVATHFAKETPDDLP